MDHLSCRKTGCHQVVAAGSRLCRGCVRTLAADLSRIPALYDECGRLLGGSDQRAAVGRTSGGHLPGLPFNSAAADARAAVRTVLASWSGMVAEARGITRPRRTVADLIDFLARHLTWLCAHEIAAEFAQEIAQLVGKARRSAQPDGGRRRVRVGGCVERDCPGDLVAMALPHESLGEIVCSADLAHRWAAREWLRLSRRLDRPTTPAEPAPADAAAAHEPHPKTRSTWLTATEVARLWRLPTGSVYRLASEHKWPRRTNAGRTFYDAAYVERTFAARAARSA